MIFASNATAQVWSLLPNIAAKCDVVGSPSPRKRELYDLCHAAAKPELTEALSYHYEYAHRRGEVSRRAPAAETRTYSVETTPRPRRGHFRGDESTRTFRGDDAAAATWTFRGDDAAAATRIYQRRRVRGRDVENWVCASGTRQRP